MIARRFPCGRNFDASALAA